MAKRRGQVLCAAKPVLLVLTGALLSAPLPAAVIEEIVVTARKRPELLLEVPVALSVFDAAAIRASNLDRLEDLARFTPGFGFEGSLGRQATSYRPVVRGLTTIRNGIANTSAVTTFIDGVYVGGSVQSTSLYNLERVEIVRGPQTTQYGRGTYAGAINYVTRDPGDTPEAELSVTGAEHSEYNVAAWAAGPLGGRLRGFVGAGYREYGGEYRNQRTGELVGDEQNTDLTGKLLWTPWDRLRIALRLGWQETDDGHFPAALQSRTSNNCCFRTPEAPRAREYYVGEVPSPPPVNLATDLLDAAGGAGARLDRRLASLRLDWDLAGGATFSSITGYVHDDLERGIDLSYAAYDPLFFVAPGLFNVLDELRQTDLSQEFRLQSNPAAGWRWTLGTYAYTGELEEQASSRVYRDATGRVVTEPNLGPLSSEEIENLALFGALEMDLGERWTLGAELRWARDEVILTNVSNDASRVVEESFEDRWRSLTPRFTAVFAASDALNVYANVARGIKPGDFNTEVGDPRFRAVDEESVWSYELGLKGTAGDRGGFALAVYRQDVEDQQLTTLVELDDGRTASVQTNAGRTRVTGTEAEMRLVVTDWLRLDMSYAWTDAEFRDYVSVEQADLLGSDGSPADNQRLGSVAGKRLPRVPTHMAAVRVGLDRQLAGLGEAYALADWSFESSRFAQEHNLIETGDRQLLGLTLGIRRGAWDLSLWGRNLLDDDTPRDVLRYFDTRTGFLPRFPQAGEAPSASPRAFVISLPRGRQLGATLRLRF